MKAKGWELVDLLKSMGMSVVAANELRSTSDKLDHLSFIQEIIENYRKKKQDYDKKKLDENNVVYVNLFKNRNLMDLIEARSLDFGKLTLATELYQSSEFKEFIDANLNGIEIKKKQEDQEEKKRIVNDLKSGNLKVYTIVSENLKKYNDNEEAITKAISLDKQFNEEHLERHVDSKERVFYVIANNNSHWRTIKCILRPPDQGITEIDIFIIDPLGITAKIKDYPKLSSDEISEYQQISQKLPEGYKLGRYSYATTNQQRGDERGAKSTCGLRSVFNVGFIEGVFGEISQLKDLHSISPKETELREVCHNITQLKKFEMSTSTKKRIQSWISSSEGDRILDSTESNGDDKGLTNETQKVDGPQAIYLEEENGFDASYHQHNISHVYLINSSVLQNLVDVLQTQGKYDENERDNRVQVKGIYGNDSVFINQELALKLLSTNDYNDDVKANNEGTHAVVSYQGFHFKRDRLGVPLAVGMENAMYGLFQILFGEGISPSLLLRFDNVKIYKEIEKLPDTAQRARDNERLKTYIESHPEHKHLFRMTQTNFTLAAAQTVKGRNLKEFLEQVEQGKASYNDLDRESFGRHIIFSILTTPTDGKAENFMVSEAGYIIGIDNDESLGLSLIKNLSVHNRLTTHQVGVKNILYCLPLMKEEISEQLRAQIDLINPECIILDWLVHLAQQQERYKGLGVEDTNELVTQILFHKGTIAEIVYKLRKMKVILKQNKNISYQHLFEEILVVEGKYYDRMAKEYPDPFECYAKSNIREIEYCVEEVLDMKTRLRNGTRLFKVLREANQTEQKKDSTIKQEVLLLIRSTRFGLCTPEVIYQIIERIGQLYKLIQGEELVAELMETKYLKLVVQKPFSEKTWEMFLDLKIDLANLKDKKLSLVQGIFLTDSNEENIFLKIKGMEKLGYPLESEDEDEVSILEIAMEKKI